MRIFYKITAGVCACFFLVGAAFAETLVLKSGKILEGAIVEQANDYIKINVDGTVLTYFNDEIDRIGSISVVNVEPALEAVPETIAASVQEPLPKLVPEIVPEPVSVPAQESTFEPAQTIVSNPAEESKQEVAREIAAQPIEKVVTIPAVESKDSGFEIEAPQGWFTSSVSIGANGNQNTNIRYTKEPEGKIGSIPQISVVMDSIPEGESISNACDFANYILVKWKKVVEDKKGILNIIENPSPVEVNGIAGCGLVAERKTTSGKILKIIDFKFIKNKTAISIQCMDWLENFDNSVPDFEAALSSFKFK